MTTTPVQIIDARGGPTKVARTLGVEPTRVAMWKLRKQIPRSVWPELIEAYPDLTLEDLKRAEAA